MVINTVGPFTATALEIINACSAAGSHYIDLANDVAAVSAAYEMHDAATRAGHTLVTGAGFGVTAIESVVVKLCADPPVRREAVLGVDTHGEVHVAAVVSPLGKVLDTESFPAVGYRRLLVWARPAIRGCVAPPAVEGPL
ncbi:hypothetical protein SUDANB9_06025 [Streptomyces sp. enrichment culture]